MKNELYICRVENGYIIYFTDSDMRGIRPPMYVAKNISEVQSLVGSLLITQEGNNEPS